jgi:DmsE family decaheme c-type cytochrome
MRRKVALMAMVFGAFILGQHGHAQELDWTKLNPAFEGATFVNNSKVCVDCHEETIEKYRKTVHSRTFKHNQGQAAGMGECESCHGPRSKHVEEPDSSLAFSGSQYAGTCLQCHQDGNRMYWQSSLHKTGDVNCISCHEVMEERSRTALLAKPGELEVCSACHADVRAEMMKSSHHPVREGRMKCSSCHNPHGASGLSMLVEGSVNETCYDCHEEKRGPFLWEHAPAREDCQTCHKPHGSNNRNLLTTLSASLCMSCHQYGGHINQYRYNRVSTPYGNGCVNCHVAIHGSNHPSGVKFDR